jgi:hypothetical protein
MNDEIIERCERSTGINESGLGGQDYNAIERERQVRKEIRSIKGYRYFGAAKFARRQGAAMEAAKRAKRDRRWISQNKNITPDYYG